MNVYAHVDGKLARWEVDTADVGMAQVEVRAAGFKIPGPVLAVINGGRSTFYFASEFEDEKPQAHHNKPTTECV